MGCPPTK